MTWRIPQSNHKLDYWLCAVALTWTFCSEKEGDKIIKQYDEHEDSVYSIAWSSCDAWVFASLSYDGRVVINHVPAAEKYKILL